MTCVNGLTALTRRAKDNTAAIGNVPQKSDESRRL